MKEKKININGLRELLLVGVVLLLCVVWTVMNPQFLSVNNITNILRQASYTAIAAVGMTMIIIIGEIDLSAGSLVCAAGLVGAVVCKNTNNVLLAILAAILVGALVGLCNGVLCAVGCLPGFIATLASMTILRGLAYIITGGNMETSRWSGIPVVKVKILVYVIMGVLTSIAGLIVTTRLGSGQPSAGLNFEMDCITASVVGGTSMSGGRGKVMGTIVGVLLLTVLTNGMTLVGMNTYWQQVLKGVIIVVSVLADTRGKAK